MVLIWIQISSPSGSSNQVSASLISMFSFAEAFILMTLPELQEKVLKTKCQVAHVKYQQLYHDITFLHYYTRILPAVKSKMRM